MAVALGVASAIVGGVSSVMSLSYQAAVATANQKQAKLNADASSRVAASDVQDIGIQGQGELGQLNAEQGGSGLSLSSGSFAQGVAGFVKNVYASATRRQAAGNAQNAAYQTEANIEGANAKAARGAIPFAILGAGLNAAGAVGGSKSFMGGSRATTATAADYLPSSGGSFSGPVPRPRLRPTPAWEVY